MGYELIQRAGVRVSSASSGFRPHMWQLLEEFALGFRGRVRGFNLEEHA